ncbi:glucokinase [Salinicola endophyticus]|uniref:Glucokinase n=1 Tax=Salinicola endophyticus TaxID=1949083 RepID=A0AB74UI46_9GAMM|nr:glucokinase [Gammaproteobacteria bacterium MFB021]
MTTLALVGDIGGTNARFALVAPGSVELQAIETLPCNHYAGLVEAIRAYLEKVGAEAPREACLAFACPVHEDWVKMTNNDWAFSKKAVAETLGLGTFKVINDFTAQALGIPHIDAKDLTPVGDGEAEPRRPRLVIGPGTGLGMAGLVPSQRHWIPLTTEGGHATFAPTDERERQILDFFRARYGRVSIERLLCGQGLLDLYLAHAALLGATPAYNSPAEVTGAARAGDRVARETLMRFLKILGSVCGDAALTLGALGGVYLCGGITPRLIEWLPRSDFRRAFADKGRLSAYTAGIPTWVVTAPWTGLLGAAEALHNEEVT